MGEPEQILISVLAPASGEEILLVEALRGLGARVVEREGERFHAIFPACPAGEPRALVRAVEGAARTSTSLLAPEVWWRRVSRDEWAARWRAEQPPRRITDRIVVVPAAPATDEAAVTGDDIVIRLAPGTAFGTAEHPTTRSCLVRLEALVEPGQRVLDVGSGSGILAIAAARLGAARVTALEIDPLACAVARENVRLNAARRVRVHERRLVPGRRTGRYDGVVANLPPEVLLPLLPTLARARRGGSRGGWLVVSGVPRVDRARAVAAATDAGLAVVGEWIEEGWWTARLD